MLLCVDTGKYGTKALIKGENGELRTSYVRTKVEPLKESSYENGKEKTYIVEFNGQKYRIGEEASHVELDTSKMTLNHKLAILLSIARLTEGVDEPINLITGCPLSVFTNMDKKEAMRKFIMDGSPFNVTINGKSKLINIANVIPLPESLGMPYKNTESNMNKLLGVIDIGGLNTNGAIYEKLKPIRSTAFTINEGSTILMRKIKHAINSQLDDVNYQDYEIPYLINGKDYKNYEAIQRIIDEVFKAHIDRIVEEMKKYNWNINGLEIAFTGGGSLDIKPGIMKYMPEATISDDGVWDNVKAFQKVGEMLNVG